MSAVLQTFNGTRLLIVGAYTYVGIRFCSTTACIFAAHREAKAVSARKIANASLSVESYVGSLPAWASRTLYVARVDPHLTAGCEVAVDLSESAIKALTNVQHAYWRRTLGLNSRSALVVLYTETGVHPLQYRRVSLAVRYLRYIVEEKPVLPSHALAEAIRLARSGAPSWISDLWHALSRLPIPVDFCYTEDLTTEYISKLMDRIQESLQHHLAVTVETSERLVLLQQRVEWNQEGHKIHTVMRFRDYLRVPTTAHRRSLARLMCSDHPLGIEQGRRTAQHTPREWRLCRFCRLHGMIESEAHVLLDCAAPTLVALREEFFAEAYKHVPGLPRARRTLSSLDLLRHILSLHKTLALTAQYVHRVFTLCEDIPVFLLKSNEELLALLAA